MNHQVAGVVLRCPESRDAAALYAQKNDMEVATLLGGFSKGYSEQDIAGWIEAHRNRADEALFVIADGSTNVCLGHVGLYNIDHRIRSAEFAIMIGDTPYPGLMSRSFWSERVLVAMPASHALAARERHERGAGPRIVVVLGIVAGESPPVAVAPPGFLLARVCLRVPCLFSHPDPVTDAATRRR